MKYGEQVKQQLRNEKELSKQIDELVESSKRVVDEVDFMASRKIGNLGGKVLTASQIRQLRGVLKQKGVHLIVEGDVRSITKLFKPVDDFKTIDDLFFAMRVKGFPRGFNAPTKQFFLSKNPTEIVSFHEMAHLKHFEEVGEAYLSLSKLDKETYVWKEILANRGKWTKAELQDALRYINDIRTNPIHGYNLEPLKIKI